MRAFFCKGESAPKQVLIVLDLGQPTTKRLHFSAYCNAGIAASCGMIELSR